MLAQPTLIVPHERWAFTLGGLPQPPAWSRYAKAITGLIVLIILGVGIGFAMIRRSSAAGSRARYGQLLDELAALDEQGAGGARRDQLMAEFENLHRSGGPE